MNSDPLDAVLHLLRAGRVDARRRDWALGRTVVVPGGTRAEEDGIVLWERVIWVVDAQGLSVVHPDLGTLARGLSPPEAAQMAIAATGEGWSALGEGAVRVRAVEALDVGGRGYVLVDVLDSERGLRVDSGATLDGCRLELWLEQPRALGAEGRQMPNRFAFVLREAGELALFAPDQICVFLSGSVRSAAGLAAGT